MVTLSGRATTSSTLVGLDGTPRPTEADIPKILLGGKGSAPHWSTLLYKNTTCDALEPAPQHKSVKPFAKGAFLRSVHTAPHSK